jgi:hypothetical protein
VTEQLTDDQLRRAKQLLAKAKGKGITPENILTRSVYLELAVGKLITHADLDEPGNTE